MTTLANVSAFIGLAIAIVGALTLWGAYHEQRNRVAEQQVRVMERDRDCNVLSSRMDEMRLRFEVTEMERDAFKAKVVELQQQQDQQPFAIQQLRSELADANNNRAHIAMELLALMAKTNDWDVSIVIRFIDYADRTMADEMKHYIQSFGPWPINPRHIPGDTIRPTHDSCRIEMKSARTEHDFAGRLNYALAIGKYRGMAFHYVSGEPASAATAEITIFPKPMSSGVAIGSHG